MHVIGIVGQIRSGKGTVEKILTEELTKKGLSVVSHRFSDVLRETEKSWHLSPGRDTQQKIVLAMREYFGKEVLANVLEKRALDAQEDVVILDGLRWIDSDYPLLRRLPNNYLIYVEAPAKIRWRRSLLDNIQKPDEPGTTFDKFLDRDKVKNELDITSFKQHANFVIDNSSNGLDNLREQVKKFISTLNL